MEQQEASQQTFSVQRLYIKESSWKIPYAPGIFTQPKVFEEWKPALSFELQVKHQALSDDIYEVVLQATATAKTEKYTAFVAEVHQAGLFKLAGFTEDELALIK